MGAAAGALLTDFVLAVNEVAQAAVQFPLNPDFIAARRNLSAAEALVR